MIGELLLADGVNRGHVIPVSRRRRKLWGCYPAALITRFGGRKLITDALSFGVNSLLQADPITLLDRESSGTPLLPLRGNDHDERLNRSSTRRIPSCTR